MQTVAVTHLGCKLNQSEAEALSLQFRQAGFDLVGPDAGPDVFVLNSCTVTHIADRKSRQALRRAKRQNPASQVIATGCYAHRAPAELDAMPEVDLVVDNRDKMRILEILGVHDSSHPTTGNGRRVRSMIKIQEGCNQVCAYCIVPKTRGRERSLPIEEILETVRDRLSLGYQEIVLTGTQLGSYGYEFEPASDNQTWYEYLVHRILEETDVSRLRFSSLQPQEITDGMIDLYRSGRLCPHVHMPLQSGSDKLLRAMRRRYDTHTFLKCVARLRAAVPQIAITTDVIVGFPGETSDDFDETLTVAREAAFSQTHIFPYSHRPGTSAARYDSHVDPQTKSSRESQLMELSAQSELAYRQTFVGHGATVLWEGEKNGAWSGLTAHYVRAFTRSHRELRNAFTEVRIERLQQNGVSVELVDATPSAEVLTNDDGVVPYLHQR